MNEIVEFFGIPIFSGCAALLAFILAFYALAAREGKTPYIVSSVYSSILLVFFCIIFGSLYYILREYYSKHAIYAEIASVFMFVISIFHVFYRILRIHNRHANFRDDNLIKNFPPIYWLRVLLRRFRGNADYTHGSVAFDRELISDLEGLDFLKGRIKISIDESNVVWKEQNALSVCLKVANQKEIDDFILLISHKFLENDCYVQYTTSIRHPIEFVRRLHHLVSEEGDEGAWQSARDRIIAVDAFTPHFGFVDTTHKKWSHVLGADEGVTLIRSSSSFAGIHSASAKGFNAIKSKTASNQRLPTLVIYEGMHALADIESLEQYKLFVRHVIPSERLWGGMFTMFVETSISDADFDVVRSYVDLDLTPCSPAKSQRGRGATTGR